MKMLSRHWAVAKGALEDDRTRVRGRVEASQHKFLPAALEVAERPVSPTARLSAWVMLGGLVLAVVWAVLGKVDIVASATGKLIPADNVKLIQPAEVGVLRAIMVRDGQRVRKGQVLVTLDPTVSGAESAQAVSELRTARLDAARARAILAALDGNPLNVVTPDGTPAEVAATQRALASSELGALLAGSSGKASDVRAAQAARDEALVEAAKLDETLPLIDQQLAAHEALLGEGFASKLKVIELRRQRMSAARDRDSAIVTARRMGAQLSSVGSSTQQARAMARAKVLDDLAKAQANVALRTEELVKSSKRSSLQQLLSPVDGTVAQLAVHTIGGVVEIAKPIMIIVPDGGGLVAEVKLLNKDAGFVRPGQDVALKLEAFPFTRFGTVPGKVESIATDALPDEKLGLVYVARIALARSSLNRGDRVVQLIPGMAITADVRTGDRSIMSYLLSPIDEARLEAGRER